MGEPRIERTSPRAVFAHWIAAALGRAPLRPSPMASAYLVELLARRLRAAGDEGEGTLAEALGAACRQRGSPRIRRMRELGDRALFVSGFFGDSLAAAVVDVDYYREIGRAAYGDVAAQLAAHRSGPWRGLYAELAAHFEVFADVLAEVGDRSRGGHSPGVLRLYERYLRTGSPRDRERLIRAGEVPSDQPGLREWQ